MVAVGPDPISQAPAGGLFVRCTEGLVAERDPVRDVMRLLLACGPSTGMTRLGDAPLEGALGPDSGPVSFDIRLKKGHCYRLFGAAGPGAEDLSVEIFSSRGTLIASDHRQDRLAVVQPDRPVCPPEDVDAQIVVLATGASAAFALEIATLALEGGH